MSAAAPARTGHNVEAPPPAMERHYTINDLAETWQLDPKTVRRMFEDEPGVLKIGRRLSTRRKRQYITLRIPASVAERVHGRLAS